MEETAKNLNKRSWNQGVSGWFSDRWGRTQGKKS
jgi:hypothetical protein